MYKYEPIVGFLRIYVVLQSRIPRGKYLEVLRNCWRTVNRSVQMTVRDHLPLTEADQCKAITSKIEYKINKLNKILSGINDSCTKLKLRRGVRH